MSIEISKAFDFFVLRNVICTKFYRTGKALYSRVPNRPHGGKKFTRLENDIDIGGRAAEMSPNIKAISGYLPKEIYNLLNAAAIFKLFKFFPTLWCIWN